MDRRFLRPTWAEVNLSSFRANIETIAKLIPPETGILAVVKADAYGIGALAAARTALTVPQVVGLAVATAGEAMELREDGIQGLLLVLGPVTLEAAETLVRKDVSLTITSGAGLRAAQAACQASPQISARASGQTGHRSAAAKAKVHLKIETGMGRIGLTPGPELDEVLDIAKKAPDIQIEGVFTHFAVADTDKDYTQRQIETFQASLQQIARAGLRVRFRHAANSAAILDFPAAHLDMVRPGIILYGSYPDESLRGKATIKPVLSLLSRVSHVKRVVAGCSIGYGRTYVTPGPSTIATIPIGYADGYPRLMSGKGSVLIRGKRFPIAGRVCMDQIMVDAGDESVETGDLVTLIGTQGDVTITVEEVAACSQTIAHEILTGITRRVPRVYV